MAVFLDGTGNSSGILARQFFSRENWYLSKETDLGGCGKPTSAPEVGCFVSQEISSPGFSEVLHAVQSAPEIRGHDVISGRKDRSGARA